MLQFVFHTVSFYHINSITANIYFNVCILMSVTFGRIYFTTLSPLDFQTVKGDPLPAELVVPDQVPRNERFHTTTGDVHDLKQIGAGPYGNRDPHYIKAPGHWKIDYNKDLHEKVFIAYHDEYERLALFLVSVFDKSEYNNLPFPVD